MTPNDALHEILRAFEAWDSAEPFGTGDSRVVTDSDFVIYMADVAARAVLPNDDAKPKHPWIADLEAAGMLPLAVASDEGNQS